MAKKSSKKQKVSAKQMREREQAAIERQKRYEESKAKKDRLKRIGIAIVCVVFALALAFPTMALTVMGSM